MSPSPLFDDVPLGLHVPVLDKGPLTTMHLVRWSAAMENWHRIHYDRRFAIEHDGLPELLVNGSFKQQFIVQCLKDWAGPDGWVWKVSFQFRAMSTVGEMLHVWARVRHKRPLTRYGVIELELGIVNDAGQESTPGLGFVALPLRLGEPVPYPFVPPTPAEAVR